MLTTAWLTLTTLKGFKDFLRAYWPALVLVGLLLGTILYISSLRADLAESRATLAAIEQVAELRKKEMEAAARVAAEHTARIMRQTGEIAREARDAKNSEGGPFSPVLLRSLDRLYQLDNANPAR